MLVGFFTFVFLIAITILLILIIIKLVNVVYEENTFKKFFSSTSWKNILLLKRSKKQKKIASFPIEKEQIETPVYTVSSEPEIILSTPYPNQVPRPKSIVPLEEPNSHPVNPSLLPYQQKPFNPI
jgi:hypothetical protein